MEQDKRLIVFYLKKSSLPKDLDILVQLRDLPAGYPFLVYRTTSKRWEAPVRYIIIDGETVVDPVKQSNGKSLGICYWLWLAYPM